MSFAAANKTGGERERIFLVTGLLTSGKRVSRRATPAPTLAIGGNYRLYNQPVTDPNYSLWLHIITFLVGYSCGTVLRSMSLFTTCKTRCGSQFFVYPFLATLL